MNEAWKINALINTSQRFEMISGLESVKITAKVEGTFDGEGEQQGTDLTFVGDIRSRYVRS